MRHIISSAPRLIATLGLYGIATAACGIELIENGSFELSHEPFDRVRVGWDHSERVGNDIGLRTLLWPIFEDGEIQAGNAAFEFPPGQIPDDFSRTLRPAGAGSYHGTQWGVVNGSSMFGSATQVINLDRYAGLPYVFGAWLASARRDSDHAVVTLELFAGEGATGELLEMLIFDGNDQTSPRIVGSLNLAGGVDPMIPATQDNWTYYKASGTIPADARIAALIIQSVQVDGAVNGDDAYVDLVSLQVVPEPSAAVLACLLAATGGVWSMRRRTTSTPSQPGRRRWNHVRAVHGCPLVLHARTVVPGRDPDR